MPTTYPTSNDSFKTPDNPNAVVTASAGDSTRNHAQSHQDMGDAIVALEENAALLTHDHSNTGSRPTPQLNQANTHQNPDTDSALASLHHTLGSGATQAAAGNHTHPTASVPVVTSTSVIASPYEGMVVFDTTVGMQKVFRTKDNKWHGLTTIPVPAANIVQNTTSWAVNNDVAIYTLSIPDPGVPYIVDLDVSIWRQWPGTANYAQLEVHLNSTGGTEVRSVVEDSSLAGFSVGLRGQIWNGTGPGASFSGAKTIVVTGFTGESGNEDFVWDWCSAMVVPV